MLGNLALNRLNADAAECLVAVVQPVLLAAWSAVGRAGMLRPVLRGGVLFRDGISAVCSC